MSAPTGARRGGTVRACSRLLGIVLLTFVFAAVPLVADAKDGSNRGGSDRSDEVRQDDGGDRGGDGGGSTDGVTEDNDSDGVPNNVPDGGDNRHPSGRDRSVENGNSGDQGNSPADPDGMTNGGEDKPGGTGGIDKADQDGNNGCGNDDDFEDDNNGRCLGQKKDEDVNVATEGAVSPVNLALESPTTREARSRAPAFDVTNHVGELEVVEDGSFVAAASNIRPDHGSHNSHNSHNTLGSRNSHILPLSGAALDLLAIAGVALILMGGSAMRWARRRTTA